MTKFENCVKFPFRGGLKCPDKIHFKTQCPSNPAAATKKNQLFFALKKTKILYEIIPLGLIWRTFEFAKNLPEKKEKNSSNCFVLFFDSSLLLPLVEQTISKKKIDAIVGPEKNKLLFIWSENWKLKIRKIENRKFEKLAIKNKYPDEINIRCHFTIR